MLHFQNQNRTITDLYLFHRMSICLFSPSDLKISFGISRLQLKLKWMHSIVINQSVNVFIDFFVAWHLVKLAAVCNLHRGMLLVLESSKGKGTVHKRYGFSNWLATLCLLQGIVPRIELHEPLAYSTQECNFEI